MAFQLRQLVFLYHCEILADSFKVGHIVRILDERGEVGTGGVLVGHVLNHVRCGDTHLTLGFRFGESQ
eukprot:CAMPEP_0175135134 /NCGR_PEP_ID=MMETSP0087-20121206/8553_1 /TAXON_ID=136419 /ORGANISM="Unknown Unknown, Strain D1" /LENGTH=67 /DNA_ID=CAMNT_0016417749 /DNA_START=513 /DNA_END=716 /DNA_ORIENTATION=+